MNDPLPVVILAGGMATRLGTITQQLPKALVDVAGEPFVTHQLRLLKQNGIRLVVLCIGHLGDMICDVVGRGETYGLRVEYVSDGPRLLGTAGALRSAAALLGDSFFVLYGDSYLTCDYSAVQEAFQASGKLGLMTVYENSGRFDTSNVEFDGTKIIAYDKLQLTAGMHHIDYGLGVLKRASLDLLEDEPPQDLANLYHRLLANDQLAAYEVRERFYEVGSIDGLEETRRFLVTSQS